MQVMQPSQDNDKSAHTPGEDTLPCVLSFNANDAVGAGGLTSDALVMASIGTHALPVATGAYLRDTRDASGWVAFPASAIDEQARAVAEDVPLQTIKVGFLGSAEAVAMVAAFAADYADVPVIAFLPDLSWWDEPEIETYLDALRDLLLPQTAVLVGNNTTLRHWLLPESTTDRRARPTELARAAAAHGVPYLLVTGLALEGDRVGNVLASPDAELFSQAFERIEAGFMGAGDILSAALAALLATGSELTHATAEALQYLDQALDHGFHPGMGRAVADRLFWAESDDPAEAEGDAPQGEPPIHIPNPSNDIQH
ncbi:hydroxymethylpyrimidine/phosphomethylpyrimidine kinase [Ottowia sp. GY511]|uniref:Hydroxymethylpyrimidine/phosphomethylpyrimidine kinase n=1 Tax=Ottowia flava TaxID=2675430 RepID=A0ABW4KUE4_9BURK|nr:bifunctional hydroxymethylpyrimidine kinase/phosphomethylpyrimidine kinase [Ottowia sp. GY511]TXK29821.1 hydroxymethylpyrimidine/phosphomethylpyrimidine kinase [Ottowia sp. GY511]